MRERSGIKFRKRIGIRLRSDIGLLAMLRLGGVEWIIKEENSFEGMVFK